jgi:hypothetical protein
LTFVLLFANAWDELVVTSGVTISIGKFNEFEASIVMAMSPI